MPSTAHDRSALPKIVTAAARLVEAVGPTVIGIADLQNPPVFAAMTKDDLLA
jgi:hypothetical protein